MSRMRYSNNQELRSTLRQEETTRFPRRRNLSEGTISMLRRYNTYATMYFGHELEQQFRDDAVVSSRNNTQSTNTPSGTVTVEICRNSFMPYDVELNQTREATSRPNITRILHPPSVSLENMDSAENRSADDSNDDEAPVDLATRREQEANTINDELQSSHSHPRDDLYDRLNNAWAGVDERLQRNNSQDPERRINLCYRNLVDQYVTLVRRYFDVSNRNRDTVSYYRVILVTRTLDFFSCKNVFY